MTSPDDLNATIDQVAREMTAPLDDDANVKLRARVLDAIDRPQRVRWIPLAATACAAVAIALFVLTLPSHRVLPPSQRVPAASQRVPAASQRVLAASPTVPAFANRFAEEPLQEESIAVAPIAMPSIPAAESIAVEQLPAIAPIAVEPLGPGEQK